MWFPRDSAVLLTADKAHYYPRKVDDDLYFTYDLLDQPFALKITANMPRHYSMQLFLREKATSKAIPVDGGRASAYRTLAPYPHAVINLKMDPKFAKGDEYELVILLSPASEMDWSESLCNFHYWEKALIS